MTLANPEKIDFITASKDGKKLTLFMVATEDLSDTGSTIELLEKKLSLYHHAIVSGQLAAQFPEHDRCNKFIRLDHYTGLGEAAEQIMKKWGDLCSRNGIGLISSKASFNPLRLLMALFSTEKVRVWAQQ